MEFAGEKTCPSSFPTQSTIWVTPSATSDPTRIIYLPPKSTRRRPQLSDQSPAPPSAPTLQPLSPQPSSISTATTASIEPRLSRARPPSLPFLSNQFLGIRCVPVPYRRRIRGEFRCRVRSKEGFCRGRLREGSSRVQSKRVVRISSRGVTLMVVLLSDPDREKGR